jgi:hypothetical protein
MIRKFRRALIVVAAVGLAVALAAPAEAGEDVPRLTVPGTGEQVPAFAGLGWANPVAVPAKPGGAKMALDPNAANKARAVGAGVRSFTCDSVAGADPRVGYDESGAQVLKVRYSGDVLCNFYLIEATGVAAVIDHTPGNEGQFLDFGTEFHIYEDYYGYSEGDFEILGDVDPRARTIEVLEELYLYSPVPWGGCYELDDLYYYLCEGVGGYLLHVVLGTGPINTGLQDPPKLYMGDIQGGGCPLTVSSELRNETTVGTGEHQVDVYYKGTIRCSAGVTGNSQAKLRDTFTGNGELGVGLQSGAFGDSTGTVTRKESQDGGREVFVRYEGRSVAPAGRTWGGCNDAPDGSYTFTRCDLNGSIVDWRAEGPVLDTELPPDRDCMLAQDAPSVLNHKLVARGYARCIESIDTIEATVMLTGRYQDNEGWHDVMIPDGGMVSEKDDDKNGVATAEITFDCAREDQSVEYTITVTGRFDHPEGWLQTPFPIGPLVYQQPCLPAMPTQ